MAGNVLDFATPSRPELNEIPCIIKEALSVNIHGKPLKQMQKRLEYADNILILGDNAEEIVFDKILIDKLGPKRCIYAVKDSPIINDSIHFDATQSGIAEITKVIDNR